MRAVFIATLVGFLISLFGTPIAIRAFTKLKAAQPIRTDAPVGPVPPHQGKRGTPTMGGVVFIVATVIAYVVGHIALLTVPERQIVQITPTISALVLLGLFVFCGAVGFIDDYLKVRRRNSGGLSKRGKLLGQLLVGAVFGTVALNFPSTNGQTVLSTKVSFVRDVSWADIGHVGAVILFVFMIIATSNAVNITDGLDGLATGTSVMVLSAFSLIGAWQYRHWCADWDYSGYCYVVRDPLEIAMIGAAAAGACVGFLWWNAAPARIFMGDTGALGLGGLIGGLAIASRTELLLPIIGGLFVILMGSVIIQMISYKTTGKRVFLMSPLQHHFELKGWSEVNIVIRFWIVGGICVALGLGIFYSDFLAHMP
ncbi:phospho-N-acetylmuramoyl-pentapeptide-transferase [Allorhizocola rhizosphaerae]|uniref:phospho-N-acetylmuramoyl-pentapeptide- transferase n=1 Tax=Allorhizocola rhizosphaerae TaxID=1872709 RepID=UPI000E3E20CC|nr:phospho-N-acetylmuramoyl-pentapeptide-transferase [Allorhizocola rhizosphaerae]